MTKTQNEYYREALRDAQYWLTAAQDWVIEYPADKRYTLADNRIGALGKLQMALKAIAIAQGHLAINVSDNQAGISKTSDD